MKIYASIILSGILLLAGSRTLPAQAKGDVYYVLTEKDPLNLRDAPGGKIIGAAPRGAKVTIVDGDWKFEGGHQWLRVRLDDAGKQVEGYASMAFLSPVPPEGLAQAAFIGLVRSHEGEDMQIRPLALRAEQQWTGVSGNDHAYLLWAKDASRRQSKLTASDGGIEAGVLRKIQYGEVGGCQVSEGLRATNPGLKSRYNRSFVVSTGVTLRDFQLTRVAENLPDAKHEPHPDFEDLVRELSRRGRMVFAKGGVPAEQLQDSFKLDSLYRFRNFRDKASYAVARFSVAGVAGPGEWAPEQYYVAFIVRLRKDQRSVDAVVFEKFDQLSEDQMGYGGQYHFENLVDVDDDGAPEIIFLHYGFDAAGYSIHAFDAQKNQWRALLDGGGDAC